MGPEGVCELLVDPCQQHLPQQNQMGPSCVLVLDRDLASVSGGGCELVDDGLDVVAVRDGAV